MPEYEIRVLDTATDASALILEQYYKDDEDAIGAAFEVANGAPFEVWRDLYCVCAKSSA
jgi:hypothetical protein